MEGDHIGMVYNLVLPHSNLVTQLQMTRTEEIALLEDSSIYIVRVVMGRGVGEEDGGKKRHPACDEELINLYYHGFNYM